MLRTGFSQQSHNEYVWCFHHQRKGVAAAIRRDEVSEEYRPVVQEVSVHRRLAVQIDGSYEKRIEQVGAVSQSAERYPYPEGEDRVYNACNIKQL